MWSIKSAFYPIGLLACLAVISGCATHAPRTSRWQKPSEGATKIVVTSLSSSSALTNSWRQVQQLKADLIIFTGDEASPDSYQQLNRSSEFKNTLEETPAMVTWNSNAQGNQESFLDFWNEPKNSLRRSHLGIYDASSVGNPGANLQVILLDTRSFRNSKSLLGSEQWRWLNNQLQQPADVRLIVSNEPVLKNQNGLWNQYPRELRKLKEALAKSSGRALYLSRSTSKSGYLLRHRHSGKWVAEMNNPPLQEFQGSNPEFGFLVIDWKKNKIRLERRQAQKEFTSEFIEIPITVTPSRVQR